jgi:hypothetical protein
MLTGWKALDIQNDLSEEKTLTTIRVTARQIQS